MQRTITASDLCAYLDGEINKFERGDNSFIKNDADYDLAKRVSMQLMWDNMWDNSADAVAEAMKTLNITEIPEAPKTPKTPQAGFARQFANDSGNKTSGWQEVNGADLPEDCNVGDLFEMMTGRKPTNI